MMSLKIRFKRRITASELLIFFGLFSFFRPTIFEKYTLTNAFFNALLIADFVVIDILYVIRRNRVSDTFFIFVLLFYAVMVYSTVVNSGSIGRMLQFVLLGISSVIFVRFAFQYGFLFSCNVMRSLAWIYVFLNILSLIIFPGGDHPNRKQQQARLFFRSDDKIRLFLFPGALILLSWRRV